MNVNVQELLRSM